MEKRIISDFNIRKKRIVKKQILIAVEGNNKTEKLYFNNFDKRNVNYRINYAKGNETDPLNLVKHLINEIHNMDLNLQAGDKAFCVFDIDDKIAKSRIIKAALVLAKKNNIEVITSTPCFELWFLLHFTYSTAYVNNNQVIKQLRKYLNYEKNMDIYNKINLKINDAIINAKKLENYQITNNKVIGDVNVNPNTEVYKLVEYLLKKNSLVSF